MRYTKQDESMRPTLRVSKKISKWALCTFQLALSLSVNTPVHAAHDAAASQAQPCYNCNEVPAPGKSIQCTGSKAKWYSWSKQKHTLDQECLTDYVKATDITTSQQAADISNHGLDCFGVDAHDVQCRGKIPARGIRALLSGTEELESLETRLAAASRQQAEVVPAPIEAHANQPLSEAEELAHAIAESLTLKCPKDGTTLDIEIADGGCNAARCPRCGAKFCYLCLKKQTSLLGSHVARGRNHAHVRTHSNSYWESRPGYKERYHWLIHRKNLKKLFNNKKHWYFKPIEISAETRNQAIVLQEQALRRNRMWPMPTGVETTDWLESVMDPMLDLTPWADGLTPEMWVSVERNPRVILAERKELLLRESVFLKSQKDWANAALVDDELIRLGGTPLASFDVGHERNEVPGAGEPHLNRPHPRHPQTRREIILEADKKAQWIKAMSKNRDIKRSGQEWSGGIYFGPPGIPVLGKLEVSVGVKTLSGFRRMTYIRLGVGGGMSILPLLPTIAVTASTKKYASSGENSLTPDLSFRNFSEEQRPITVASVGLGKVEQKGLTLDDPENPSKGVTEAGPAVGVALGVILGSKSQAIPVLPGTQWLSKKGRKWMSLRRTEARIRAALRINPDPEQLDATLVRKYQGQAEELYEAVRARASNRLKNINLNQYPSRFEFPQPVRIVEPAQREVPVKEEEVVEFDV